LIVILVNHHNHIYMKRLILILFTSLLCFASCTAKSAEDSGPIECDASGLRDALRFFGVKTRVTKDGFNCRIRLEWISEPEDSRTCLTRLRSINSLLEHYTKLVSEPVSLRSLVCPYETEIMETDSNAIVDTGVGNGAYDEMTYAKYESFVRIVPHQSFLIQAIEPGITGCAGLCQFSATIFSPEGHILGAATWSWTSYGRKALEDDLRGSIKVEFDNPVPFKKGVSYLMLAVASVSSAENVDGGSIRIHTTGIDVVTRNVQNAQVFPLGPVSWQGSSPNPVSDRGPISFKLLGKYLTP
jgi:hypothetical protein